MRMIPFPINCSADITDYRFAIRCYMEAAHAPEPVWIDLGNVEFLRPMGLTLLAGMIYDLLVRGQDVFLIHPLKKRALQYMTDQGFYEEFRAGESGRLQRTHRSTSLGLRRLDELDYSYLSSVTYWLHRNSPIPMERIEDMVMITMPEVINNVLDHSQSAFGCYVCAQAYPEENRLLLSVLDFGVGFLSSLYPQYPQLSTDADAIALAVRPGVSSKSNKRNAGRGLYILRDWIKGRHGVLEIISRDGVWIEEPNGIQNKTLSYELPGTCINLSVNAANLPGLEAPYEERPYD